MAKTQMKTIPLSQGQFAIVDDENFETLSAYNWYAQWCSGTQSFYAVRKSPGIDRKHQQVVYMHRQILGLVRGDTRKGDHINHDTLDNTEKNLRIASASQNQFNQRLRRDNTSGHKGVWRHSYGSKWSGRVRAHGKAFYCGLHDTPELAEAAVREMTLKLHAEFANVGGSK